MTIKDKLKRWAILTIFTGESDGEYISLELDVQIRVDFPRWGQDRIMGFSIGLSQFNNNNTLFLTGNFWSGGMFEYNITDDTIAAQN